MIAILRDDEIPKPPNVLWIATPKAGKTLRYLCYAPKHDGYWTHWTGKVTLPCFGDPRRCHGECNPETRRWYGFIHAWGNTENKQVFLQLTPGAVRSLRSQLAPAASLRGLSIDVSRGNGRNAHVSIHLAELVVRDPNRLPPWIDSEPSVRHFWKIKEMDAKWDRSISFENGQPPSQVG
jgi:hypothetical protein